ncbi:MAG: hypothetical protein O7I42_08915 [Alphaproteobacteria bacterium]|nr:hypothetical protein [Alphaproteobacteria bacterium]
MNTNLIKTAAAALIAALAAGAMLPGEVAAKPSSKPPISKSPPPLLFKKGPALHCSVHSTRGQRKIIIANSLGYTLSTGTRIIWRAKGSRGSASGVIKLSNPLGANSYVDHNVLSTILGCRAWIITSIYR